MTFIPRIQLFEIEDFSWYPSFLRKGQTDFLRWMMGTFKVFENVWPTLLQHYQASGKTQWIDLCSGGGGAILQLRAYAHNQGLPFKAALTDLYPNSDAFSLLEEQTKGDCQGLFTPVNALNLPKHLPDGFATIFNAFHHFDEKQAISLVQELIDKRVPFAILEPNNRSIWQLFANTLSLPILQFLVTPFLSPFRWSRIIFTYLIPIIPLVTLWDGWVSVGRTYTVAEMQVIARQSDPSGDYQWEVSQANHPFGKVNYMIGRPIFESQ